jgi:protein phosphatase
VRCGTLTPDEAAHHRFRHVVTNVVGGTQDSVEVEFQEVELQPEDVVLLCTDGLTDMLSNDQIAVILQTKRDPQLACERLVEAALEQGGQDNVTAIVTHLHAD